MKKLFLSVLAVVLFGATSALACGNCGCANKGAKEVKTLADGEKTSCATKKDKKHDCGDKEKCECKDKSTCPDCTVVDGKKVMCEKCLAKKADNKDHDDHDEKAEKKDHDEEKEEHNH